MFLKKDQKRQEKTKKDQKRQDFGLFYIYF